jgi:hypothetical protein
MGAKKGQKLTMKHVASTKDFFGLWEVTVLINGKEYTYPITSEHAVKKIESLLRNRHPGKALNVLRLFSNVNFNSFKEE